MEAFTKTLVIYRSQTGFTEQYAKWLAEDFSASCVPFDDAKKYALEDYDTIIFGSWCSAGTIQKLKWFKEKVNNLKDKRIVVFAVGACPIESPDVEPTLRNNFTDDEWNQYHVTYCPGGLRYDRMKPGYKMLMNMFAKSMASKKDKTESEAKMAEMIATSYDIADRKYLDPILSYVKS